MNADTANAGAETVVEQLVDTTPSEAQPPEKTADAEAPQQQPGETASEFAAREKKLLNAMSHRDRRIGKLTAQRYETEAKIRQLEEQLAKYNTKDVPKSTAPETSKFDNYEDYLVALADYKVNEKLTESEKKRQQEQSQVHENTRHVERVAHLEENDIAAREHFPDFENVFKENEPVIMDAPDHVKKAFLEADNPAYAFYALAKEGKLEDLFTMSPYQVVSTIGKYEDKGLALSKTKQVTKAPAPLAPAKGTGGSGKSLNSMSGNDLLDWVKQK